MKYINVFEVQEIPLIDPIMYLFLFIVLFSLCVSLCLLILSKRPLQKTESDIATVGLTIAVIVGTMIFFDLRLSIPDRIELREKYASKQYEAVEGAVTNFNPMPVTGHQSESFTLGGKHFEYSDYHKSFGFNNTASHGGPIYTNGQYLRLRYVKEKSKNIIMKIEIRQ